MAEVDNRTDAVIKEAKHGFFTMNWVNLVDGIVLSVGPAMFFIWEDEFGLSPSRLGWIASTRSLLIGLSVPLWGYVGDHSSRRVMVLLASVLICIVCACTAAANGFGALMATRALTGLFSAALSPAKYSLVPDWFPENRRGRAFGTMGITGAIGSIMGTVLATSLGDTDGGDLHGWRITFLLLSALQASVLILAFFWLKDPERGGVDGQKRGASLVTLIMAPSRNGKVNSRAGVLEHKRFSSSQSHSTSRHKNPPSTAPRAVLKPDRNMDTVVDVSGDEENATLPGSVPSATPVGAAAAEPAEKPKSKIDTRRVSHLKYTDQRPETAAATSSDPITLHQTTSPSGTRTSRVPTIQDISAPNSPSPAPRPLMNPQGGAEQTILELGQEDEQQQQPHRRRSSNFENPDSVGWLQKMGNVMSAAGGSPGSSPLRGSPGQSRRRMSSRSPRRDVIEAAPLPEKMPEMNIGGDDPLPPPPPPPAAEAPQQQASQEQQQGRSEMVPLEVAGPEVPATVAEHWKYVLTTPSVQVIAVARIVGSFPWQSFTFLLFWFTLIGLSPGKAAVVYVISALGLLSGFALGGVVGDRLNARYPRFGRLIMAQVTVAAAIPILLIVLLLLPRDESSLPWFCICNFFIANLTVMGYSGFDFPAVSDVVLPQARGSAYMLVQGIAGVLSAFGPLMVGYIAEEFGYLDDIKVKDMTDAEKEDSADALANAIILVAGTAWTLLLITLCFAYRTYPADKAWVTERLEFESNSSYSFDRDDGKTVPEAAEPTDV